MSDVAHLVAELLENATHFSPPDTKVRIDGARTGGSYQLVITDQGVGMRSEQLEELNGILRNPPVTGLALGRSLGCLVAGRLADRHGITVRLRAGDDVGVSAYVVLPRHLLVEDPPEPLPATPSDPAVRPARRAPVRRPVFNTPPAQLTEAIPARSEFDAGLKALLAGEGVTTLVEPRGRRASESTRRPAFAVAFPAPPLRPCRSRSRIRRCAAAPTRCVPCLSRYRSGLQAGRGDGDVRRMRSDHDTNNPASSASRRAT